MWWKNLRTANATETDVIFQYPLRVNVVEKPQFIETVFTPSEDFQYPLRVNVVEKPVFPAAKADIDTTFSTLSGSMWWKNWYSQDKLTACFVFQYPLRVNVVEKPKRSSNPVRRATQLSVPSPGQCGGKTMKLPPMPTKTLNFQYPLRVNVVEKPVGTPLWVLKKQAFSTLSGSMWWKNQYSTLRKRRCADLSVPSPGQCGGKTVRLFSDCA